MVEKTKQHIKEFYYNYNIFNNAVIKLANIIRKDKKNYGNIYSIPRGGYVLGVYLSHELGIPLLNSTNIHMVSTGTLIVDDICDTGNTLSKFDNLHLSKIVLVTKSKGLNKIKNLIYDIKVENNVWVRFPWEKK